MRRIKNGFLLCTRKCVSYGRPSWTISLSFLISQHDITIYLSGRRIRTLARSGARSRVCVCVEFETLFNSSRITHFILIPGSNWIDKIIIIKCSHECSIWWRWKKSEATTLFVNSIKFYERYKYLRYARIRLGERDHRFSHSTVHTHM